MEKGLGQLCLWERERCSEGFPFPHWVAPCLHPASHLQPLGGPERLGSQAGGGGGGDFPDKAPTPPTAA